jgi:hypothetical protein
MTTAIIIYVDYAYTLALTLVLGHKRKLSNPDSSDRD